MNALKLFAVVTLAAPLQVRAASSLTQEAIYNGKAVAPDGQSWRSTVGLRFGNWACSGTFIAEDLILTAAHCDISNNSPVTVSMYNDNSLEPTVLEVKPGEFTYQQHPDYIPTHIFTVGINDVAILVLRGPTIPEGFLPTDIQTSNLARLSFLGNPVYAAGLGVNGHDSMSDHVYFAQGEIDHYESGDVMTVELNTGQGICGGDSGGPVFVKSGSQLYLTAVITARGNDIAKECGRTLYANRISADRYTWITNQAAKIRTGRN